MIQSITFRKSIWSIQAARAWLFSNNYPGLKPEEKVNSIRFAQVEPKGFVRYRIKNIGHGISLVMGFRK